MDGRFWSARRLRCQKKTNSKFRRHLAPLTGCEGPTPTTSIHLHLLAEVLSSLLLLWPHAFLCACFLGNKLRALPAPNVRSILVGINLRELRAEKHYLRGVVYPD